MKGVSVSVLPVRFPFPAQNSALIFRVSVSDVFHSKWLSCFPSDMSWVFGPLLRHTFQHPLVRLGVWAAAAVRPRCERGEDRRPFCSWAPSARARASLSRIFCHGFQ